MTWLDLNGVGGSWILTSCRVFLLLQANFQEQIFKVGQGERLENLPPLDIPCPPSAPDLPPPQVSVIMKTLPA